MRVYLVDDSATSRFAIKRILVEDPAITAVGEASSAVRALKQIPKLNPDVVVMDIVMPELDGLAATERLMSKTPMPILLISDLVGRRADLNFRALQAGALDVIRKPEAAELSSASYRRRLQRRVKLLADVPLVTRRRVRRQVKPVPSDGEPAPAALVNRRSRTVPESASLIAIGASTGGPPAVLRILEGLEHKRFPPIVVVQHIADGFEDGMLRWLRDATGLEVRVVSTLEMPVPGVVYFAGGGGHTVWRRERLRLEAGSPVRGHMPSADVLFHSLAAERDAPTIVAALLTGMGDDGARGLLSLADAGAFTIAQDKATSAVYGMPKAADELGAASKVLSLDAIVNTLGRVRYADEGALNRP